MKKYVCSCILLTLLTALFAVSVQAEDVQKPTLALESVSTDSGSKGDLIEVALILENNPGMVSLTVPIEWDATLLSLEGIKTTGDNTAVIPSWYGMEDLSGITDKYYAAWNNDTYTGGNYKGNGVLCTLVFELQRDMKAGESSAISIDEKDWLLSIMDFDMNDYSRNEVPGKSFDYNSGAVTFTGENTKGYTVKGTITSYDSTPNDETDDTITIELSNDQNTYTKEITGSGVLNYTIENVQPGQYTLTVKKAKHVTRTYIVNVSP